MIRNTVRLAAVAVAIPAALCLVAVTRSRSVAASGVTAQASGGGHYDFIPIGGPAQFSFTAVAHADGSASGEFHHSAILNGQTIDFHAEVTCMSVDLDNGRAWIGGVVTQNNSTDPDYQQDIYQPGQDIWFRVLDSGQGSNAPADRITFTGFKGGGGIDTSAQYCAARIWPDGNARTWEVTGNIQVR
jgi:hypothetical protein